MADLHYAPFETAELTDTYDLIFTSPPFFDFENGQSVKSYPKFETWFSKFLIKSLNIAWAALEENGFCVIHLTDVNRVNVCEPMCLYMVSELKAEFVGCFCSVGLAGKPRPMWVFKKSGGINQQITLAKNSLKYWNLLK